MTYNVPLLSESSFYNDVRLFNFDFFYFLLTTLRAMFLPPDASTRLDTKSPKFTGFVLIITSQRFYTDYNFYAAVALMLSFGI